MVANQVIFWLKKNRELCLVIIILLVAAFLRLYRIGDYMTFLGDEGRDMLVVKRMIVDHKWTLLGPTASVGGFFLGPIYYYFILPFLWLFNFDPTGPAVMVALFGIATVYLVYRVGKDFFRTRVGLLAACLYAISPLVINYSRASWNPNLMPFFSLLILYLLWQADKKPKYLIGVGLGFGILFQLHYLATFLVPVVLVYSLIFYRHKKYWRYYLLAVGAFLITFSPFLFFEIRHGFPNFNSLYNFIFYGKETGIIPGKFLPIVGDVIFRLFNRIVTININYLAWILILTTLPIFFCTWYRSGKSKIFTIMGLWLIFGVLMFGFYQKGIYDYYFGFMYPLPFLITASSLNWVVNKSKILSIPIILLVGVLFYFNLKASPILFEPNRQMAQTRNVAQLILEKTQGNPYNFALITGSNSDHAYRYFLESAGKPPVTIENVQNDPERKTVTEQLIVVCETLPCAPEGHSLWEIAGFGRAQIVDSWDIYVVKVYKLVHFNEEE